MSETDLGLALADHSGQPVTVGRYILHRQIARGGMATIHIARLMGDEGFSRIVAAKRLHPEFSEDSEFVAMFLDEARIASKVHHKNVVPVLDVVTTQDEVLLVQEYVHGAPLHWLINKVRTTKTRVPVDIAVSIACQVLAGLHAAHEMVDELGVPLNVVHRDVSPQNVMIATDGTARLLDFGVAKASMAAHTTREGTYKGKLAYSAPEQLRGAATRQSDLYSLAVLLWELIIGHRMHGAQSEAELVATIMNGLLPTITETLAAEREWGSIDDDTWAQLEAIDPVIRKGLAVELDDRFTTATEMEDALIRVVPPAASSAVATWLKATGKEYLDKNDRVIAAEETSWRRLALPATHSRRTPIPGAMGLATSAGVHAAPAATRPLHPDNRTSGSGAIVALLGALVIAAAIVIVLLARGEIAATERSAPSAKITPVRDEVPTPIEAVRDTPVQPAPVVTEPETAPETANALTEPLGPASDAAPGTAPREPEPRPTTSPPTTHKPVRVAPRPTGRITREPEPRAIPEVIAPPVAMPEPAPATECNPPYYFQGSKKIFKPACL